MHRTSVIITALMGFIAALLPVQAQETGSRIDSAPAARIVQVGRGPDIQRTAEIQHIRLASGVVDTSPRATPVRITGSATRSVIVQFDAPITERERRALEAAGAEIVAALGDNALRVRAANPRTLATINGVRWTGRFQPELRVHPNVEDSVAQLRVVLDPGSDVDGAVAAAEAAGATVAQVYDGGLIVFGDRAQAVEIAGAIDAVWIERMRQAELHNEGAGLIIGGPAAHAAGYDGSGQIVAVADTGLGDGTAAGAHPDIPPSRIVAVLDYPAPLAGFCAPGAFFIASPDGAQDVDSGHGTHVAGSVLSDGDPAGLGLGAAPGASLVFQAVEDYINMPTTCENQGATDGYYLFGIPADLADLIQPAYDLGARIHQNSWGSSADLGAYTEDAAAVDQFIWDNPDLLYVTSAGNSGVDTSPADGVVDSDSIGSPATAKNALTVGASENERAGGYPCDSTLTYPNVDGDSCASIGGENAIFTWGAAWGPDFPAPPLSTDLAAGNAEQMAAFSSRGPTDDGRIKPDVVAPGSWILSGYSGLYKEGYGTATNPANGAFQYDGWGFPATSDYKYMGGTSMSSPLAAGAAAVVRDFYATEYGHNASAALVKATLINSAHDLADENNDGVNDNYFPIPNEHEGWGRIDLVAATDDSHAWLDGDTVDTGEAVTFAAAVDAGTPLRISLVWSDYPGANGCGACLVNDLDLQVTGPDGTTYVGNNFADGWTTPGVAAADTVNNVENVYIESPVAGTWTVTVTGTSVPMGPQPFALVVDADFGESVDTSPPTWTSATISVDAVGTDTADLSWSGAADDVAVVAYDIFSGATLLATTPDPAVTLTGLTPGTTYTVTVQGRDAVGNVSSDGPSATFTTVEMDPPSWDSATLTATDIGETGLTLAWDAAADASGVARYLVTQDDVVIAQTTSRSLAVSGLAPATSYEFAVQARDTLGNTSTDGPAVSATTAPDFADTNGHIFESDIAWLAGAGITQGCDGAGNFCPDATMTRAQMASLLARALNLPAPTENRFDDVSGVHAANINAIAEAGITIGCTDDGIRFCPDDPVSRGQMATFIDRAFALLTSTTDYFTDDTDSVHEAAINRVAETRITLGCTTTGLFCPLDNVTRGQIAAFLHRTFVNLGLE